MRIYANERPKAAAHSAPVIAPKSEKGRRSIPRSQQGWQGCSSNAITPNFNYDFSHIPISAPEGRLKSSAADTRCNSTTGKPFVVFHGHEPCAQECTEAHEQVHCDDLVKTGACQCLHEGWKSAMASPDFATNFAPFERRHMAWLRDNKPRFECNAYSKSLSCASRLLKKGNCDAISMRDTCCQTVRKYNESAEKEHKNFCAQAQPSFTPYPA
jgi:hypothetical protein